jgi:DNA-binding MarR family transcriptional regulator
MPSQTSRFITHCHSLPIRLLARRATRIYDESLRSLGIKSNQLTLLAVIAEHGPIQPAELSTVLATDISTLSRNLSRMQARGWITSDWEDDARTRPFRIGTKGRRLLKNAVRPWKQAQKKVGLLLGKEAAAALHRLTRLYWTQPSVAT